MSPIAASALAASRTATPWLSVLVPVYNAEPFLAACIESLAVQVPDGVEIVLLDDCSSDGSWQVMQGLQHLHAGRLPLRLLRHAANQGVSVARNALLDAASGDYVWFIDADDQLVPQALGVIGQALRQFSPDLLMFDFSVLRERVRLKHRLRGEGHRRSFCGPPRTLVRDASTLLYGLFLAGQFHPWSKVVRRVCWNRRDGAVRFPEGRPFAEDMAAISRLALRVQSAVHLPEVLVQYRQHGGNVMARMDVDKMRSLSAALQCFNGELQAWQQQGRLTLDAEAAFAISHLSARNYMGAMRFLAAHPQGAEGCGLAREFARNYFEASPLQPEELLRTYLRKGWMARYWRARQWLPPRPLEQA